jgi:hypothetical protein
VVFEAPLTRPRGSSPFPRFISMFSQRNIQPGSAYTTPETWRPCNSAGPECTAHNPSYTRSETPHTLYFVFWPTDLPASFASLLLLPKCTHVNPHYQRAVRRLLVPLWISIFSSQQLGPTLISSPRVRWVPTSAAHRCLFSAPPLTMAATRQRNGRSPFPVDRYV